MKKKITAAVITALLFFSACANVVSVNAPDDLNMAIRDASDYLNTRIPPGSKIVILNIQSDSEALSEYIIDELIANAVNDDLFEVVDRQQLDLIRTEQDFHWSGEVDDNFALEVGRFFGAQSIVSGRVIQIGDRYRFTIRALDVQTARVQGQNNINVSSGATISALMRMGGSGLSGTTYTTARTPGGTDSAALQAQVQEMMPGTGTTTTIPAQVTTATYRVGDIGPAGGLIFYDKGNSIGGWRYLEAAPASTERTLTWGRVPNMDDFARTLQGDDTHKLGKGLDNTRAIMAFARENGGGFGWAAQYCDTLEVNGFDDWFLPSWDELSYMYGNLYLQELGDFKPNIYLSSNIWNGSYNHNIVFFIDFTVGKVASTNYRGGYLSVDIPHLVRAARRF